MERQSYLERDRDSIRTDFAPQAENVMLVRGSCLCRAVGYEARLPFAKFVNCHCSRCRKASGSAFAANAYVLPDAFRWTRGEMSWFGTIYPKREASRARFAASADRRSRMAPGAAGKSLYRQGRLTMTRGPTLQPMSTGVRARAGPLGSASFRRRIRHTCHRDPSPSQSSRRRSHHFMCGAGR